MKQKLKPITLLFLLIVSACCEDKQLESKIFIECLQNSQKQIASGAFNYESDVVNACKDAAQRISFGECK